MGVFLCGLLLIGSAAAEVIVTASSDLTADVLPKDGRIAVALLGNIWLLPANGGPAERLTDGLATASQPRWSPDGTKILYQVQSTDSHSLWVLDVASRAQSRLSNELSFDQDGAWHPDGERVVFSAASSETGFDLWEIDIPTGLRWRISKHSSDEIQAVWSKNGRHLAYIRKDQDGYALVLRRRGEPEVDLLVSQQPLSSPSWRPDGSLLTVLRQDGEEKSLDIVILSSPPLIRQYASNEDFIAAPVSWKDRQRMLYTADGAIKSRGFGDRRSLPVPFTAMVAEPPIRPRTVVRRRELALIDAPHERLVIRGARLFDGIWGHYRDDIDVLLDSGRIAAVEPRRDWPGTTVLDLGDVTILPGFIDTWSALPTEDVQQAGARILSYGVTTIVSTEPLLEDPAWNSEQTPGPRVLFAGNIDAVARDGQQQVPFFIRVPATTVSDSALRDTITAWQAQGVPVLAEDVSTGLAIGADWLPADSSAAQWSGIGRTGEPSDGNRDGAATLVSALAAAGTAGVADLLESRQSRAFGSHALPRRRFSTLPRLAETSATVVVGSKPNGLPPGLATHAELRALAAAGLPGDDVLLATGHRAATILGLDNQIGRITPGALADLVLVSGDPLGNVADALAIVAVVRNGRFYSLVSLLERATAGSTVE